MKQDEILEMNSEIIASRTCQEKEKQVLEKKNANMQKEQNNSQEEEEDATNSARGSTIN